MKDYTKGGLIEGIGLGTEQAFVNYINKKHKDMKKECRIKEINEQIKRLKKEKKKLNCVSKYLDFSKSDIEVDGFPLLMGVNDMDVYPNASFWLSSTYNWKLIGTESGIILLPTKK